jgi:hypothetical protein
LEASTLQKPVGHEGQLSGTEVVVRGVLFLELAVLRDRRRGALGQQCLLEGLADRRLLARVVAPFVEVETVAKDVDLELDLVGKGLLAPALSARNSEIGPLDRDTPRSADAHVAPPGVRRSRHGLRHRDRERALHPVDFERSVDDVTVRARALDRVALKEHARVLADVEETVALQVLIARISLPVSIEAGSRKTVTEDLDGSFSS